MKSEQVRVPTVEDISRFRSQVRTAAAPAAAPPPVPWRRRVELLMAGSVKPESVANLLHSLSLLIRSGIPIDRSIKILAAQELHPGLRDVLFRIDYVLSQQGQSLAVAVKQFPQVFSPATMLLIQAGDISGELSSRAEQAASLIDRQIKLNNQVKQAISTPAVTAVACLLMTWGVVRFVLPKFLDLYDSMHIELPLISQIVVDIVKLVNDPFATAAVVAGVVLMWSQRARVGRFCTSMAFANPMTRRMLGQFLATSFCDVLGRLYADGVSISTALDMLADSTTLREYSMKLKKTSAQFKTDGQLSEAMKLLDFFPPAVNHMVRVGEETGSLDKMLLTLHDLLDEQNQDMFHRAVVALEPLMMGMVGGLLSFLSVGLFLPIYTLLSHLGL